MNHVRVGWACLLVFILALALPFAVFAQAPQSEDSGSDRESQRSIGGAAISEGFLSKDTGQGETVSPDRLTRRSSGLRPVIGGSLAETASPQVAETSDEASPSEEEGLEAESTETEPAPEVALPQTEEPQVQIEPVASQIQEEEEVTEISEDLAAEEQAPQAAETFEPVAQPEVVITPDMIAAESPIDQAEQESAEAAQNQIADVANETSPLIIITPEDIIPPENITIPENETALNETVPENETEAEVVEEEEEEEADADQFTNRIWREGISPLKYIWDYKTFSGFFYDFEEDIGTEQLEISLQPSGDGASRSVDSGDLVYRTVAKNLDYEFEDWGSYNVIGFMADKYFAGFEGTSPEVIDRETSLLNEGQLRRVLIDSDEETSITSGSVLALEEGYELRIKEIDINGNRVFLSLARDGEEIDDRVVSPDGLRSSTYRYEVDIAGRDTPIIMAHILNVFRGTETDLVTVDGIFQISDTYASVEAGDKYGEMEVETLSGDEITMENEDSITLRSGRDVGIFDSVGFQVADNETLRFAPYVERTGTFDVRGTVITPGEYDGKEFTWDVYNFEGFYYDIDEDVGTEKLIAKISGTKIEDGDLIYETRPQSVSFEFNGWGKYDVVGFMADKFFAGYNDDTEFADRTSIINEGELRKVLKDEDEDYTIGTGSVLPLEEGYELRIKQVDINGNKVFLGLAKNGEEVDDRVVTPSADPDDPAANYLYKVDIGAENDVPIIAAHISSVFRGTEADLATVDGIFQVSDTPESVEEGEVHGKMEVEELSSDGIVMQNDGAITLSRGRTLEIMENLKFMIADNEKRNFAPIAEKTVGGMPLRINVSEAVANMPVRITVRSDSQVVSGAQVSVGGNTIGNTDATGTLTYTPENVGTFEVTARKTGYNDARSNIQVMSSLAAARMAAAGEAMADVLSLSSPPEVVKGENFLITVTSGVNQTPVEGANITFNNDSIGETNAQGTLTYASSQTGEQSIKAEKEGYVSATRTITVVSPIKVLSLEVPQQAGTGQTVRMTVNIRNDGASADTRTLELKVNDEVVETREVTVEPGENTTQTFSYRPDEPGAYRISVDGQSAALTVEKTQNNMALIALILVLLIAIGAGAYLYKTGELEDLKKRLQGR